MFVWIVLCCLVLDVLFVLGVCFLSWVCEGVLDCCYLCVCVGVLVCR